MGGAFTMEGPLSKWTNVVNGWQYRWFVLDFSVGVLFYYTSKEKMMRGDRRGCVKLKNAQVGIDDVDDSTFTITVDHKTFHFQARDADERQKWLDALQEARDLHTQNYALLHQTNRLLEHPTSLSEFDRRIVEADAYLQILIDQQQELSLQNTDAEECQPETVHAICDRMQSLIELVKKTIVCLQFARETMNQSYSTVLTSNRISTGRQDQRSMAATDASQSVEIGCDATTDASEFSTFPETASSVVPNNFQSASPRTAAAFGGRKGEGDGAATMPYSYSNGSPSPSQGCRLNISTSSRSSRRLDRSRDTKRPASATALSELSAPDAADVRHLIDPRSPANQRPGLLASLPFHVNEIPPGLPPIDDLQLTRSSTPMLSYSSSSEDDRIALNDDDEEEFFDTQEEVGSMLNEHRHSSVAAISHPSSSLSSPERYRSTQVSANNQDLQGDENYDELYDDNDEADLGCVQSQGSVITHLLSQLRIGMDLTRITLPTFILERRSTLEMYADFLAHADLWAAIPDAPTPRHRIVSCLRWYLSAYHAGRRSSIAKKPYNPILGEIFRCYWSVVGSNAPASDKALIKSGPVPWAPADAVVFLAEQVSHHPPISAFYAEHVGKRIALDGHLWTKSKFLGLSLGVEMVGSAVISLLSLDEEYVVTFPCAYGRNILAVPWIELGGKTSIICPKSGYVANVEFKTKPFYNGKRDLIKAEVLAPNEKKPFLVVEGEWNDKMWAKWDTGQSELFIDTRSTPTVRKQVLPRSKQSENESRRLWEQVTYNLKAENIDAATDAKCRLEQKQRDLARQRQEAKVTWIPEHFRGEGDNWIYRSPLVQRMSSVSPADYDSTEQDVQSNSQQPNSSVQPTVALSDYPECSTQMCSRELPLTDFSTLPPVAPAFGAKIT
ncbi:unnamed protein product [Calicophoron daubneyi]|uniref:Oxysterol-binding protein n=1 Tax=Calicophoron daubneyi TaxID=300641 RepID=A0AAV2TIG1_CALDB